MTCYQACVKPVAVQVEWGLFEFPGKPKNTPRKIPFNKAHMCNDCYSLLKQACMKEIDTGKMHWKVEKVAQKTA